MKTVAKYFCLFFLFGHGFLAVASKTKKYEPPMPQGSIVETFEGRFVKKWLFFRMWNNHKFVLEDSKNKIVMPIKIDDAQLEKQVDMFVGKEVVVVGTVEFSSKKPYRILKLNNITLRNQ